METPDLMAGKCRGKSWSRNLAIIDNSVMWCQAETATEKKLSTETINKASTEVKAQARQELDQSLKKHKI